METPFVLTSFGGSYSKKSIFASRQPGHVKHLLSGLYDLLKYTLHSKGHRPATPGSRIAVIFGPNFAPDFFWYFWLTIQNTANRHVSNALDLLGVFISFCLARASALLA